MFFHIAACSSHGIIDGNAVIVTTTTLEASLFEFGDAALQVSAKRRQQQDDES
jgi:hypothetical protein